MKLPWRRLYFDLCYANSVGFPPGNVILPTVSSGDNQSCISSSSYNMTHASAEIDLLASIEH